MSTPLQNHTFGTLRMYCTNLRKPALRRTVVIAGIGIAIAYWTKSA